MSTTLEESSRRAGAHQWAESRLFEILGSWVSTSPEPEVRLLLDCHSQHCAWRASLWWDRLPVLADVERAALCRPSDRAAEAAARHMASVSGTVGRLACAYRVALPRLWTAYERHRRAAGGVSDGSVVRTLGIVSPDLAADWHEGETLLQELLSDPANIQEAAAAAGAMEAMLAAVG